MNSPEPGRAGVVLMTLAAIAVAWTAAGVPGAAVPIAMIAALVAGGLGVMRLIDRRRLRELRRVAAAFAAGNVRTRASIGGRGSIASLGQDLNRLGESLAAAHSELEALRLVLDGALGSLAEGVACIDTMDRTVYANPAWRHLAAGGVVVVGAPFYEHLPAAALAGAVGTARRDGTPADGIEFDHRRRRLRAAVARANGDVVVLVLHDLTELKRLESARRDFVAAVSHELKTPLTAIAGFAETLLDGTIEEDPAATRDFVGRIARHADRLTVLVRDVLTLSRLEQGSWTVHPAPCNISELARQVADEHQAAADARQVHISISSPTSLEAVTDPELLRQLLGNLVSNAVRYNRSGGSVAIRLSEVGDNLCLAVQDTGIGIPVELRERVFERFFRVDAHRSRQSGGTGLGLAIVKQLTDTLRGSITLESGPEGSLFSVVLPRSDPRVSTPPTPSHAPHGTFASV